MSDELLTELKYTQQMRANEFDEFLKLQALNAELLEFAEQFVKWAHCPREEKDNLIELAEQAIAKAKTLKIVP